MADDDWLSGDFTAEESAPPAEEAAAPAEGGEKAAADSAAPADAAEATPCKVRDPTRPIYFKHWQRPTRLQYSYLYDYRQNYYDDVLDYLDRRRRGLQRDIPRPQTWAERVLRTYNRPLTAHSLAREHDKELLHSIRTSVNTYQYHSKDFIAKRYPVLL